MLKRSKRTAPVELAQFYKMEYPRVVGALRLYLGDTTLAEDLAQDAFVKVCRDWEKVSRMAAPGAWVHRVAMNGAKSKLRRRKTAEAKKPLIASKEAISSSPAHRLDIRDALLQIDHDLRAVVVLRFYSDLSVAQTADALEIPTGTVKTRTRKALNQLKPFGLEFEEDYVNA